MSLSTQSLTGVLLGRVSQELPPLRVQDIIPLCMHQYSRIFGTVRVPHAGVDTLEFYTKSTHIVVISKNRYFRVEVRCVDGPRVARPRAVSCWRTGRS